MVLWLPVIRLFFNFFLTASLIIILSCSKSAQRKSTPEDRSITIMVPSLPPSIDEGADNAFIFHLLHEGLTRFVFRNGTVSIEPAMAESWNFIDSQTLRVRLRASRSLDGRVGFAFDIAHHLKRQMRLGKRICKMWGNNFKLTHVPEISVIDDLTLLFKFREPSPTFAYLLSCPELWPVNTSPHKRPPALISAGPFQAIFVSNKEWQLDPSPNFRPLNSNLHLTLRSEKEYSHRVNWAQMEEINLVDSIDPQVIPKQSKLFLRPIGKTLFLKSNMSKSHSERTIIRALFSSLTPEWLYLSPIGNQNGLRLVKSNFDNSLGGGAIKEPQHIKMHCPETFEELCKNITAQWQKNFPVSIERVLTPATAHISLLVNSFNPENPFRWPSQFPYVESGSPVVLSPTVEWLENVYQRSMQTLMSQSIIIPIGELAVSAIGLSNDFTASPYDGWDIHS